MKALAPTNETLSPRLKFSKRRSNSKVKIQKVKVMVSIERSITYQSKVITKVKG
jgi:hypothetical protein